MLMELHILMEILVLTRTITEVEQITLVINLIYGTQLLIGNMVWALVVTH